jgi:glycosyltransferase involved in cell wall biosynthesis
MNNKIVLHIHQKFLPYQGGSTQRLLNLIDNGQSHFKHIVMCINSEGSEVFSNESGIDVYRFNKYWQIPALMKRIFKENDISLVHLHNYRPAFFGYLGLLFTKNIRSIFELHSVYRPNGILGRLLAQSVHHLTKDMIVLSESSVTAIRNMKYTQNIHIIRNGINIEKFRKNSLATSLATKKNCFWLYRLYRNISGGRKICGIS